MAAQLETLWEQGQSKGCLLGFPFARPAIKKQASSLSLSVRAAKRLGIKFAEETSKAVKTTPHINQEKEPL